MTTIALSGSRSGIGAATAAALAALGHRVIGIDLRDADVCADLSDPAGRAAAVQAVLAQSDGVLDGLVLCAGLGAHVEPASKIVEVNYFGESQALVSGAVTVQVWLSTGFGTPRQRDERLTVRLTADGDSVLVGEFEVR